MPAFCNSVVYGFPGGYIFDEILAALITVVHQQRHTDSCDFYWHQNPPNFAMALQKDSEARRLVVTKWPIVTNDLKAQAHRNLCE